MAAPVLVYGWYGRRNAGDELMKLALGQMLRVHRLEPKFVEELDGDNVNASQGVIFGGGSILQDCPVMTTDAWTMLAQGVKPVFYVGVGGETEINEYHQHLIDLSPVVAFRELDTPDLAYWLGDDIEQECRAMHRVPSNNVLVLPNAEVLPTHDDPHWMHASWEHFKNEFAQVLDRLVERGHGLSFLAMCDADKKKDVWATHELMGRMKNRDNYPVYKPVSSSPLWVCGLMQSHSAVITQRYHGIILAEMSGVSYVSISHHNKLKLTHPHRGLDVSYYGVQKDPMTDAIENALAIHLDPYRPPRRVYDDVISQIAAAIKEHR